MPVYALSPRLLFPFLAALLLAVTTTIACGGEPAATPTPAPTPFATTPEKMHEVKNGNRANWSANYLGKPAAITGLVSSVAETTDYFDLNLAASMIGSAPITAARVESSVNGIVNLIESEVVCKVDKSNASAIAGLTAGTSVTVIGTITDEGFFDLVVADCTLQ